MNAEQEAELAALREENSRLLQNQQQNARPLTQPTINRVAVKLPPFWAERPSLWFSQAESQFIISDITNETTKFHYVVSQLDTRVASEVEDIITSIPEQNPFTVLKKKLIERLSASEEQRVRQLISDEELGNRKPSQFLRHLRSLAGPSVLQDNLLRQLWLRRLPSNVQAILTSRSDLSPDQLSELADKIVEVSPPPIPFAVHATSNNDQNQNSQALFEAIDTLTRQVAELSSNRTFRNRSKARGRQNSRSSSKSTKREGWCWYHSRYQHNARKCNKPCSFQGNLNSSL
ncbi:uncharacterized protein LOC129905134 [Episyrphus balteatus]|uniref:uncharacterized protein LOC129905134 n=1 Tax=Episyrphus balteatus TaxID=286459 RepID=UPI00248562DB|nr:uncharacterized protein LOC129905134 [Episyrphus balteatus]